MASRREAFRLLGITPSATEAEVRAAFRKKVIENHPDTALGHTDGSSVRRLIDAYHLLIDPAPRTEPKPPVTPRDGRDPVVHRVDVKQGPTDTREASTHGHWWCADCMATGLRIRWVTCPACRGGSVLTTLDVGRVQVDRCRRCHGRGRVLTVGRCQTCDGIGASGS